MKVVFTVATYYPKTDGVQLVTKYQAEGLVKKGYEVVVITSKFNGTPDEEIVNGVLVKRVDGYNFYYWHKGNKKQFQSIVKVESKDALALVAVCLQSFAADWLLDILDEIECKKILYLHGMPDFKLHLSDCTTVKKMVKTIFRNTRWKIFYSLNYYKIKKFDAITHLFKGDNSYKYFTMRGYENNYVIENACDDVFFEDVSEERKNKYFIYVGNYCDRKNQELALQAYYKAETGSIGFVFIGSSRNEYYEKLVHINEDLQVKYGSKNVQILYGIPRERISEYTKEAYACVISSNYEYYPITIVEALAAGIPFVSTNVGIVRYLPGGIIANDCGDISYWLEFLARNKEYKDGLGKMGKEYAQRNLTISSKVELLDDIIKGRL